MQAAKIAAIGECMIELAAQPNGLWRMGFAGDTFNTLWTLKALLPRGIVVDYVSAFGEDPFSIRQIEFFGAHGIGIASSPRLSATRPGLYAITLEGYERSFTYWRSDSAARRLADDATALQESLVGRDLILFSGITLAILDPQPRETLLRLLKDARSSGSTIAFDPNYRPRLWPSAAIARKTLGDVLSIADIALPTYGDERILFGDKTPQETLDRLRSAGVVECVVKNGAESALVHARGSSTIVPAIRVDKPLDTTGAGDAFNGAYLAARLTGHAPPEAARKAHMVASRSIQTAGALMPMNEIAAAFNF